MIKQKNYLYTEVIMQYQGGKSRISKQITEVIHNEIYGWKAADKQANFRNNRERERVIRL